jgi:hypothetical protein
LAQPVRLAASDANFHSTHLLEDIADVVVGDYDPPSFNVYGGFSPKDSRTAYIGGQRK